MGISKSNITKLTNRLKKMGFSIKRSHSYQHSSALVVKNGKSVYISSDDTRPGEVLIRIGGEKHSVQVDNYRNNFSEAMVFIEKLVS
jgi:hypothetical protein